MAAKKVPLQQSVRQLCFHKQSGTYIAATAEPVEFSLANAEPYKEVPTDDSEIQPLVDQGRIQLIDPESWIVTQDIPLAPYETVTSLHSMAIEVNEKTHRMKEMIVVATVFLRGMDVAARSKLYIYEVADVVPQQGRPETAKQLISFAQDNYFGIISAMAPIGTEGCIAIGQGQKIYVRGIKQDGLREPHILPTAFLDSQLYTSVLKRLPSSGFLLLGDHMRGLWLVIYNVRSHFSLHCSVGQLTDHCLQEAPYKLIVISRSEPDMKVVAAEFLPTEQFHLAAADADGHLHIFQYDPRGEHPLVCILPPTPFNTILTSPRPQIPKPNAATSSSPPVPSHWVTTQPP
jgi:cleavage and polyadenylation specificity factor subunit 1